MFSIQRSCRPFNYFLRAQFRCIPQQALRFSKNSPGSFSLQACIYRPFSGEGQHPLKERAIIPRVLASNSRAEVESTPSLHNLLKCLGVLAAGYGLHNEPSSLFADEEPRGKMVSASQLKPNVAVKDPGQLGLEEDINNHGWYKVKDFNSENPFRVQIIDGQLIWKSFKRVYSETASGTVLPGKIKRDDIRDIARFYSNFKTTRSLYINTGIHANEEGIASTNETSGSFPKDDIIQFTNAEGDFTFSVHIVSPFARPVYHDDLPFVDILDAWCFSSQTTDFRFIKEKAEMEKIVAQINLGSITGDEIRGACFEAALGFSSKLKPYSKYVKLPGLIEDIAAKLAESSICCIEGIGGMGKSRVAWELEKEKRDSIEQDRRASLYVDTVYISLKSAADRDAFYRHARKIVIGSSKAETKAVLEKSATVTILEKYFELLGQLAQKEQKKVFIVIDNIDTEDQRKELDTIYVAMRKFHAPNSSSPFKLLLTGRREDMESVLRGYKIESDRVTVKMDHYCNDSSLWEIFSECFLEAYPRNKQQEAKSYLESRKNQIVGEFKKYGHHIAYTLLFGTAMAKARFFSKDDADDYLSGRAKDHAGLLQNNTQLNDYGKLSEVISGSLEPIDKFYEGKASKIYEVIALFPYVHYPFLRKVLERCYNGKDMIETFELHDILMEFYKSGLINFNRLKKDIAMPPFYRKVIHAKSSREFESRKAEIGAVIGAILDEVNPAHSTENDEKMIYVISLFNYYYTWNTRDKLFEMIFSMATAFAKRKLVTITQDDLKERYWYFLNEILRKPGFSLNPVLIGRLTSRDLTTMTEDQILLAESELELSGPNHNITHAIGRVERLESLSKNLNNLYVFSRVDNNMENMEKLLNVIIRIMEKIPEKTSEILKHNLKENLKTEDLVIFSEFDFISVGDEQWKIAEVWKNTAQQKGLKFKADLQSIRINEGLRTLIPFLFEENKVEEINLSNNALGLGSGRLVGVRDLLRYPGSLKILRLDNNYLLHSEFHLLAEGLRNNATLECLVINNNSLYDNHIKELCDALAEHKKIRVIELHHNRFTDQGLSYLEELMRQNPHIEKITTQLSWPGLPFWSAWHNGTLELFRDQEGKLFRKMPNGLMQI